MKINMSNKKTNLIVTSIILAVILAVGIVVAVDFISFRNYDAYFSTDYYVDEVQYFYQYSPNLKKGTVSGDTEIFIKYGDNNTVGVALKENAEHFETLEGAKNAISYTVQNSSAAKVAASQEFNVSAKATIQEVWRGLVDGDCGLAVVPYSAYREAKSAGMDNFVVVDAEIEAVPSILVLGGTHGNEPAGQLAATVILENAKLTRGTLYVITETNRSGYSCTYPQEASPEYYEIKARDGSIRTFKYGARATNTVDQWPTPDIYTHSSGQTLSSGEVRNINRAYPGSATGNYTERTAYAVTELIRQNNITITVDLHEASPEYSNINQGVFGQNAEALTSRLAMFFFAETTREGTDGTDMPSQASPINFHGLTHRELNDYTNTYALLFETSNASQGKYRGKFNEELILYSKPDTMYSKALEVDGLIWGAPVSIDERVARHVTTIKCLIDCYNKDLRKLVIDDYTTEEKEEISIKYLDKFEFEEGWIPSYFDILDNGVGAYLAPAKTK